MPRSDCSALHGVNLNSKKKKKKKKTENFAHISRAHNSQGKGCSNVKSSTYYFHLKAKILADFEIYISVPLMYRLVKKLKVAKNFKEDLKSVES